MERVGRLLRCPSAFQAALARPGALRQSELRRESDTILLELRMTSFIRSIALASFFVVASSAQDIGGIWQGTLGTGSSTPLRLILHIAKDDQGNWTARLQS